MAGPFRRVLLFWFRRWVWKPGWDPCTALPICLGLKLECAAWTFRCAISEVSVSAHMNCSSIESMLLMHLATSAWPSRLFHRKGIPCFMKKEQCHCEFGFKICGLAVRRRMLFFFKRGIFSYIHLSHSFCICDIHVHTTHTHTDVWNITRTRIYRSDILNI